MASVRLSLFESTGVLVATVLDTGKGDGGEEIVESEWAPSAMSTVRDDTS